MGWARALYVAGIAWRPHLGLGAALLAAPLLVARRTRPAGLMAGALAVTALAPAARRVLGPGTEGPAELTILAANVLSGRADTAVLAALITHEQPDLVVLPEAGHDYAGKLVPLLDGYRYWSSTPVGRPDGAGVVLLAQDHDVDAEPLPDLRGLRASGGILGARTLLAVHLEAPMGARRTLRWQQELDRLRVWAAEGPLVVGDLNATLDHRELRLGLQDAGALAGRGLVGTYPSFLPRALGIAIDHVLVPLGTLVSRYEVHDLAGSDHRAVLAGVTLPRSRRSA